MIYYKEKEKDKMLKNIKSWVKMGVSVYSVFPVKGGYLFHPNLMSIQFARGAGIRMEGGKKWENV